MYKLIVSSFLNTIINDYEEIPMSTVALIDELRRSGIKFVIATGKDIDSIIYYNRDFPFNDYLITSNGAYIYDMNKNKVIFKKNIGIRTIKRIIKYYYDKSIIYLTNDRTRNLISKESIYKDNLEKLVDKDKFIEENKNNIYKIDLYFENKLTAEQSLKEISLLELDINTNLQIYNDKYYIEITHSSASKDKALELIAKKLKIDMKDIISFGSGYSDIELLTKTYGVAMKNACKKLKSVANDITLDNNSKGVEIYLKKIHEKIIKNKKLTLN